MAVCSESHVEHYMHCVGRMQKFHY